MKSELQQWLQFIRAESYLLHERPSLLWQQAYNQPESSLYARSAQQRLPAANERVWFRWLNKPKSQGACLATFNHQKILKCLYSPDGKLLVTFSNRTIELWDAETTQKLGVLAGHEGLINWVEFSPDGRQLISVAGTNVRGYKNGQFYSRASGDLKMWNLKTLTETASAAAHAYPATRCVFSPDQELIATGSEDGEVKLWQASDLAPLATLTGHSDRIKACIFSDQADRLVTASDDGTVRLWTIDDDEQSVGGLFTFHEPVVTETKRFVITHIATMRHRDAINGCVISPDGKSVLSYSKDCTLRLSQISDGTLLNVFEGHTQEVLKASFSHDGATIASAGQDKTLRLWDTSTGKHLATLTGHEAYVTDCDFSPDDHLVVSASADRTLKLWEVATRSELATFIGHTFIVFNCCFAPDGRRILSAAMDDTAKIWDSTVLEKESSRVTHGTSVNHCMFSDDGAAVASVAAGDGLRLWNVDSLDHQQIANGQQMHRCNFVLDDSAVMTASTDGSVTVWNIKNKHQIAEFTESETLGVYAVMSPDGSRLFKTCIGWRSGMRIYERPPFTLWDVASAKQIAAFGSNYDDIDGGCDVSTDGSLIVTARFGAYRVKLWDGKSGLLLREFTMEGRDKAVSSCALSPDNQKLAVTSADKTVQVWRLVDGAQLFEGRHNAEPRWCGFSPEASHLVTGDETGNIKVWHCQSGIEFLSFPAHGAAVSTIIFSPDGRFICSRSLTEGSLKLWDLTTGQWLAEYRSGADIRTAALDRRWRRMAVGSSGGEFDLLELKNLSFGPAIATSWRDSSGRYGCTCPICARWQEIREPSLGDETTCRSCGGAIRLNRFALAAEWRSMVRSDLLL